MHMYADDHQDTLPPAASWCDAIQRDVYKPTVFQCRADKSSARSSYAFNAQLGGRKIDEVNPQTVMIFECPGGWNVSGGASKMITRHQGNYVVCYVDGSVEQVSPARLSQLRWNP